MNKLESTAAPGLIKLGASLLYELLTVIAIIFVATGLFLLIAGDATHGYRRLLLQVYLWVTVGAYFVWCWLKGGQTLAMQAWKLGLVGEDGKTLSLESAILRYLLATLSLALLGLGFFWAVIDKEKLYLHDRLLKNRVLYRL